jgi:hypothetical protein
MCNTEPPEHALLERLVDKACRASTRDTTLKTSWTTAWCIYAYCTITYEMTSVLWVLCTHVEPMRICVAQSPAQDSYARAPRASGPSLASTRRPLSHCRCRLSGQLTMANCCEKTIAHTNMSVQCIMTLSSVHSLPPHTPLPAHAKAWKPTIFCYFGLESRNSLFEGP